MVKLERCEQCGRKAKYLRSAFHSWRCQNCGVETEEPSLYLGSANRWWSSLSADEKIGVWKKFGKGGVF